MRTGAQHVPGHARVAPFVGQRQRPVPDQSGQPCTNGKQEPSCRRRPFGAGRLLHDLGHQFVASSLEADAPVCGARHRAAALDLIENAGDIFAHHSQGDQVDAGEEQHGGDDGGPAGDRVAQQQILSHQVRGVAQAKQGHEHAGQADHAQRPGRERGQAVQGQAEQAQSAEAAAAMQALVWRIRQGFALESDPGVQPLHETGALGQGIERVHHAAIHQAEITGVSGHIDATRAAQQLVEPARRRAWPRIHRRGSHARRRPFRRRRPNGPASARSARVGVAGRHPGRSRHRRWPILGPRSVPPPCRNCATAARSESRVLGPLLHQRLGAVGAAIVGDDDLPARAQGRQPVAQQRQQNAQVGAFVQTGMTQLTLAS